MEEKMDTMLEKVEPNRRDFIKKVAIGAAYAVPVMASFNLDSVRNKAFAQASYVSPASPGGPVPPEVDYDNPLGGGRLQVFFTKRMDMTIGGLRMRVPTCYNREVCVVYPNGANGTQARSNGCVPIAHSWENWPGGDDKSQILDICEFLTNNVAVSGMKVIYKYGLLPPTDGCIEFKDTIGLPLVPSMHEWELGLNDTICVVDD